MPYAGWIPLLAWAAPALVGPLLGGPRECRCHCACENAVESAALALLGRQLERCGPERLTVPPSGEALVTVGHLAALAALALAFGAGFWFGRRSGAPALAEAPKPRERGSLLAITGPVTPATLRQRHGGVGH